MNIMYIVTNPSQYTRALSPLMLVFQLSVMKIADFIHGVELGSSGMIKSPVSTSSLLGMINGGLNEA